MIEYAKNPVLIVPVRQAYGFSLVETVVAAAIVLALTGTMIELARTAKSASAAIGDLADLQQKLRIAADAIQHDLVIAGAGSRELRGGGPLVRYLPPIRPSGGIAGDTDLTWAADRITLLSMPHTIAEAEVTGTLTSTGSLPIGNAPGCLVDSTCGFARGMQALVFDRTGPGFGYEVFSVGDVSGGWLSRAADEGGFSRPYGDSAYVSEVIQHTYYLDRSNPSNVRLMRSDGRRAFPLVDDVTEMRFRYYADADPMSVSIAGASGGTCVYAAGAPPRPLLSVLGGQSLAEVAASELTDGPFCGFVPNRFDADLLRIRRVRVYLRVGRSAVPAAFSEVSFDVSPRNLNLSR